MDPAARVVMVTAVQQGPITGELLEKGAAGILHKPLSVEVAPPNATADRVEPSTTSIAAAIHGER